MDRQWLKKGCMFFFIIIILYKWLRSLIFDGELDNPFKEYTAHDTKCNIYLLYISDTAAEG